MLPKASIKTSLSFLNMVKLETVKEYNILHIEIETTIEKKLLVEETWG